MVTFVGSVEFSTGAYEFSHGKKPRGFGMWAFHFGHSATRVCQVTEFTPSSMNYGAAKAWAVARAKAQGFTRVVVGS